MAFSKLSGDEQGVILGQLRNALEPRLWALLPTAARQQLRADYEEAMALCVKLGMRDCKELREATKINWFAKGLSAADLATLAKLGSVLPALKTLVLDKCSGTGPDGVQRLAEGLVAGALPAVTKIMNYGMHLGDAGASALAAALGRGALPQLEVLWLGHASIGDAGLVALAPALRRRPALRSLILPSNPFGDDGLAALVAPPPPAAGTPPPPAGGLKNLMSLGLGYTQVTDAGCATLGAAIESGALPAIEELILDDIPASDAATEAVYEACPWLYEAMR